MLLEVHIFSWNRAEFIHASFWCVSVMLPFNYVYSVLALRALRLVFLSSRYLLWYFTLRFWHAVRFQALAATIAGVAPQLLLYFWLLAVCDPTNFISSVFESLFSFISILANIALIFCRSLCISTLWLAWRYLAMWRNLWIANRGNSQNGQMLVEHCWYCCRHSRLLIGMVCIASWINSIKSS